jgi:Tfp pilus assembly ATPase PilU
VYGGLRWQGSPWTTNASIIGRVRHNRNEKIRYVVEKCEPGRMVSYVGHSNESGFASHRAIHFLDREQGGTLIEISYYSVGSHGTAIQGEV